MNNQPTPQELEICLAGDELQTAINDLKQSRNDLREKILLDKEISILTEDVHRLKGEYTSSQLQEDCLYFLRQTWRCTEFVCGGVLNALDKYFTYIQEKK